MSEFGNITLQVRTGKGKGVARSLRRQQRAPGIVYGGGQDNVAVSFSPMELGKATDPAKQGNTLFNVTLTQDGQADVKTTCMLTEIQRHPLRTEYLHVDFMRVDLDKEIVRTVPVRYEGRAVGVAAGGRLRTFLKDVRISAKPADVPEAVVIDLTPLEPGQSIRVADVNLDGITLVASASQPLALVELPKAERPDDEEGGEKADGDKKPEEKKE